MRALGPPAAGAVVCGVVTGAAYVAFEHAPGEVATVASLGSPWLLGAFVAGALARSTVGGVVAGVTSSLATWAIYYIAKDAVGSPLNPPEYDHEHAAWLWLALVAGLGAGLLGGSWRARRQGVIAAAAVGVFAGAVAGEIANFYLARGSEAAGVALLALIGPPGAMLASWGDRLLALAVAGSTLVIIVGARPVVGA